MPIVSDQDIHDFYFELGRFFHVFSAVEIHLRMTLTGISRLEEKTAKAVFYSTRVDDGTTQIKRIYKARGKEVPLVLSSTLQQLGFINQARNSLVHHGTIFSESFETSNWAVILSPEDERVIPVPPDTLQSMSRDLGVILNILGAFGRGEPFTKVALKQDETYAWLYKPPQQGGKPKDARAKSRKSQGRKRSRPPQSSPE